MLKAVQRELNSKAIASPSLAPSHLSNNEGRGINAGLVTPSDRCKGDVEGDLIHLTVQKPQGWTKRTTFTRVLLGSSV